MASLEPILKEKDRFIIFPVKHNDIWDWYQKAEDEFFANLATPFPEATPGSKSHQLLVHLLISELYNSQIAKKFFRNIQQQVQYPEAEHFFALQKVRENQIHQRCSKLLNQLTKDFCKTAEYLERVALKNQKKQQLTEAMLDLGSFSENLLSYLAIKKLFLSTNYGVPEEFSEVLHFTEKTRKAQNLHFGFGLHLYHNHLLKKTSEDRAEELLLMILDVEKNSGCIPGIPREQFHQHLEFRTDELFLELGFSKRFHTPDPYLQESGPFPNRTILKKRALELKKKDSELKDEKKDRISKDTDL